MNSTSINGGLVVAAASIAASLILGYAYYRSSLALADREDEIKSLKKKLADAVPVLDVDDDTKKAKKSPQNRPVRIYVDGCFDMMHYGHANALRQAGALGDQLIVGLVTDEQIVINKGSAPVMPEHERYEALAACKFVHEIIRDVPYDLTEEWVNQLIRPISEGGHGIDFICHGDDPCFTADGRDAYAYAKSIGRFKLFKRTEGISTTDIVGRMLLSTKDHHLPPSEEKEPQRLRSRANSLRSSSLVALSSLVPSVEAPSEASAMSSNKGKADEIGINLDVGLQVDVPPSSQIAFDVSGASDKSTNTVESSSNFSSKLSAEEQQHHAILMAKLPALHSKFLPTARRIMQFAEGKVPKPTDRVVYIAGGWDLFHAGHIAALKEAKKFGDFLIVGIHDDETINKMRDGHGLPVLNLYERTLSLLSCRYVDEVVIGAPYIITHDLLTSMNISAVVKGTVSDSINKSAHDILGWEFNEVEARFARDEATAVAKQMNILHTFESPSSLTALDIIDRIVIQREQYQRRFDKKSKTEAAYNESKTYVEEN
jgi:ethanolamine-phosphate cytidylyltransferase